MDFQQPEPSQKTISTGVSIPIWQVSGNDMSLISSQHLSVQPKIMDHSPELRFGTVLNNSKLKTEVSTPLSLA